MKNLPNKIKIGPYTFTRNKKWSRSGKSEVYDGDGAYEITVDHESVTILVEQKYRSTEPIRSRISRSIIGKMYPKYAIKMSRDSIID